MSRVKPHCAEDSVLIDMNEVSHEPVDGNALIDAMAHRASPGAELLPQEYPLVLEFLPLLQLAQRRLLATMWYIVCSSAPRLRRRRPEADRGLLPPSLCMARWPHLPPVSDHDDRWFRCFAGRPLAVFPMLNAWLGVIRNVLDSSACHIAPYLVPARRHAYLTGRRMRSTHHL